MLCLKFITVTCLHFTYKHAQGNKNMKTQLIAGNCMSRDQLDTQCLDWSKLVDMPMSHRVYIDHCRNQ